MPIQETLDEWRTSSDFDLKLPVNNPDKQSVSRTKDQKRARQTIFRAGKNGIPTRINLPRELRAHCRTRKNTKNNIGMGFEMGDNPPKELIRTIITRYLNVVEKT